MKYEYRIKKSEKSNSQLATDRYLKIRLVFIEKFIQQSYPQIDLISAWMNSAVCGILYAFK